MDSLRHSTANQSGQDAYRAYLRSRLWARGRLTGIVAISILPAWALMDWLQARLDGGAPIGLLEAFAWRLSTALLPITGLVLLARHRAWGPMPLLATALAALYCGANDAVSYLGGRPLSLAHATVLFMATITPLALLPVERHTRGFFFLLVGALHVLCELLWPGGRSLEIRAFQTVLLVGCAVVVGIVLEGLFASHLRGFELRARGEETLAELTSSRTQVASAIQTLAGSVVQLAAGADELTTGTESSRTESQDIASATGQVAGAARTLEERSRAGVATAAEGLEWSRMADALSGQVEESVQAIGHAVEGSEASVRRLEERTERISTFVEMVQEMAAQTQMLAVNAGLEAHRAGEAGVGFDVIAREVRALAQQVAVGGRDVERVVEDVRTQLADTLRSVETVRARTAAFSDLYGRTREALERLGRAVSSAETAMRDNARDATEQAASTLGISQGTARLSERVEVQARLAGEVGGTARELARLAQTLESLLPRDGQGART